MLGLFLATASMAMLATSSSDKGGPTTPTCPDGITVGTTLDGAIVCERVRHQ